MRTGIRFSLAVGVALVGTTTWAVDEESHGLNVNVGYDEFYDSTRERPNEATAARADIVPVASLSGATPTAAPAHTRMHASTVVTPRPGTSTRVTFDDGTWLDPSHVPAHPLEQ